MPFLTLMLTCRLTSPTAHTDTKRRAYLRLERRAEIVELEMDIHAMRRARLSRVGGRARVLRRPSSRL